MSRAVCTWWPTPSCGVRLFRPAALWLLLPSIHIKHRSRGNFVLNSGNSFKSYSPEYFTWVWLRLALLFLPLNLCSLMPTNSKITQRCLGEGNRERKKEFRWEQLVACPSKSDSLNERKDPMTSDSSAAPYLPLPPENTADTSDRDTQRSAQDACCGP